MYSLDSVNELMDSTTNVSGVQIGIVGSDRVAILGTGEYKKNVGTLRPRGCYFQYTVETGESYVVTEPRQKGFCCDCELHRECIYTIVMCAPVTDNHKTVGVAGILGYDKKTRELVLNKLGVWKQYISDMAKWFSYYTSIPHYINTRNLAEKEIRKRLGINDDDGIIITDNRMSIIKINRLTYDLLGHKHDYCYDPFGKKLRELIPPEIINNVIKNKIERISFVPEKSNNTINLQVKETGIIGIDRGLAVILSNMGGQRKTCGRDEQKENTHLDMIKGKNPAIIAVKQLIKKVAPSNEPVMITGESGTGKELVAEALHSLSLRSSGPLISVNCAAIPDTLAESELFGYEAGAFTGASKAGKKGKFELAQNGTLFLDEIGELSLAIQAKLLRALEKKEISRVGGTKPVYVDVRIVAATNLPLERLVRQKRFREDLFYRLNVIPINMPSLRARIDDIPELVRYFLALYHAGNNNTIMQDFSQDVLKSFQEFNWPGNVRQLRNVVNYLCAISQNEVAQSVDLPSYLFVMPPLCEDEKLGPKNITLNDIKQALEIFGTSTTGKKRAAEHLGISLPTLYRKMGKMKHAFKL